MIKTCEKCGSIPHSQDKLHGKGKRVFNETVHGEAKCTVCGHSTGTPGRR